MRLNGCFWYLQKSAAPLVRISCQLFLMSKELKRRVHKISRGNSLMDISWDVVKFKPQNIQLKFKLRQDKVYSKQSYLACYSSAEFYIHWPSGCFWVVLLHCVLNNLKYTEAVSQKCSVKKVVLRFRKVHNKLPVPECLFQ